MLNGRIGICIAVDVLETRHGHTEETGSRREERRIQILHFGKSSLGHGIQSQFPLLTEESSGKSVSCAAATRYLKFLFELHFRNGSRCSHLCASSDTLARSTLILCVNTIHSLQNTCILRRMHIGILRLVCCE